MKMKDVLINSILTALLGFIYHFFASGLSYASAFAGFLFYFIIAIVVNLIFWMIAKK